MSKIFTVKMPDIGEGVAEGEVIEWLKKVNDPISQDEPVVIVMTDKATVELPSPHPGKLAKQYYAIGQMAPRDKPLYDIEIEGAAVSEPAQAKSPENAPIIKAAIEKKKEPAHSPVKQSEGSVLATPHVRHLAREMGIQLEGVSGTGKEGRITEEDLKKSHNPAVTASTQSIALEDDEIVPLIGIRQLMARKMKEAKSQIPHFSYFEQLDATRLVALRQKVKEEAAKIDIALTFMPFFIKALSLTIKRYPTLNSNLDTSAGQLIIHKQHNIGVAMTTPLGLIVPILKGVQEMSLEEIIKAYDALKVKAQNGKLASSDMKESTITISNFGVLGGGGLWATPIINYPEAAILAVAKIQKQPIVKNGELVVRDTLNLSWSFDHRIIDGDMAASCSHFFSELLQNPASLL